MPRTLGWLAAAVLTWAAVEAAITVAIETRHPHDDRSTP